MRLGYIMFPNSQKKTINYKTNKMHRSLILKPEPTNIVYVFKFLHFGSGSRKNN